MSTQVDSLHWEVNQLDVENRKLRSQNADASEQADLELKVEQLEGEARTELLVMKELLANKQTDCEQTIGAREQQLAEATMRFQSAKAEILHLLS